MPVKKVGKKWEVDGEEYNTEAAANNVYQAKLALALGIEPEDKKSKKSSKKKSKKDDEDEEADEE